MLTDGHVAIGGLCCQRRKEPDDDFFREGNLFCNVASSCKLLTKDQIDVLHRPEDHKTFACQIASCQEKFGDTSSYESHYNSRHRNVCSSCRKSFPTCFLLDAHISEEHDPIFMNQHPQGKFRCLVESCSDAFGSAKERKDHMTSIHKYPSSFHFGRNCSKQTRVAQTSSEPSNFSAETRPMELDDRPNSSSPQQRVFAYSRRVPQAVSFGHGVARGFKTRGGASRGRGRTVQTCVNLSQAPTEVALGNRSSSPIAACDHARDYEAQTQSIADAEVDLSDVSAALPSI